MELVEVEITGMAITARYGTLAAGTFLRTDAAYAKHLVEDCSAAKYTKAVAPEQLPSGDSGLPGVTASPQTQKDQTPAATDLVLADPEVA